MAKYIVRHTVTKWYEAVVEADNAQAAYDIAVNLDNEETDMESNADFIFDLDAGKVVPILDGCPAECLTAEEAK